MRYFLNLFKATEARDDLRKFWYLKLLKSLAECLKKEAKRYDKDLFIILVKGGVEW